MGYGWHYHLSVPLTFVKSTDNWESIIRVIESNGFELRLNTTAKIQVWSVNGVNEFDKKDECIKYLCQNGGSLSIWQPDPIGLEMGIGTVTDKPSQYSASRDLVELSLSIDNGWYRESATDRKKLAKQVEKLYVDLAVITNSNYGFVQHDDSIHYQPKDSQLPALFGITLLGRSILEVRDTNVISDFIHHIEQVNDGKLIFFDEFPWEIYDNEIKEANKTWHKTN